MGSKVNWLRSILLGELYSSIANIFAVPITELIAWLWTEKLLRTEHVGAVPAAALSVILKYVIRMTLANKLKVPSMSLIVFILYKDPVNTRCLSHTLFCYTFSACSTSFTLFLLKLYFSLVTNYIDQAGLYMISQIERTYVPAWYPCAWSLLLKVSMHMVDHIAICQDRSAISWMYCFPESSETKRKTAFVKSIIMIFRI